MRVAVVCPYAFDAHGGVQDQVARIVGWLRDDGHEAWAVAPGSAGPDGTRHVGRYRNYKANRSKAPISMDLRVRRRVAAAVDDADVVHVHEPLMPMVSLGAVLTETPPKVGTFHADPGGIVRMVYRIGAPVLRLVVRRLGAVTAVSEVAAGAIRSFASPRIVPNGIDLDAYASGDVERVPGRVLFLGRDDPRKGLDVLLDAWPSVRRAVDGADLHVVGASRPEIEGVEFLGRVDEAEKVGELAAATILATPNLGGESFGIVVLEGLASGCAIVASDLDAFRGVAGDAAEYVPVGDSKALGEAMVRLLTTPALAASLGSRGRERAGGFGRTAVLGGYLAAYEEAMAGP